MRERDEDKIMRGIYIKKMREAGATLQQIGDEFGLTRTRVEHILYGKKFVSRKRNASEWDYLKERVYEIFHSKCFSCHKFEYSPMEIIPLDANRRNLRLDNLVPICRECQRDWYYKNNNNE